MFVYLMLPCIGYLCIHHCLNTYVTVPDVPRNFTLETIPGFPMQLLANWISPQPTNGRITSYTLHCVPDYSMANNFTEVLENDARSFTLGGLRPFTNYSCHISASTVAGPGPFSDMVTAETDESGERGSE